MKDWIAFTIVCLMFAAVFGTIGYSIGNAKGWADSRENRERIDCEMDYGRKPLSEVPVECLKFFDLPKQ